MLTDKKDTPGDHDGIPLATLGDVQREMAKVYRDMRKDRIDCPKGNALVQSLQYLAHVMQDQRDSKWLPRVKELWREKEARTQQPGAPH